MHKCLFGVCKEKVFQLEVLRIHERYKSKVIKKNRLKTVHKIYTYIYLKYFNVKFLKDKI